MAPERLRILIEFWPKELEPHLTILATLWLRSPGQVGVGGSRREGGEIESWRENERRKERRSAAGIGV